MSQKLLSVDAALDRILNSFHSTGLEDISLKNSLARILAKPVTAPFDLPPFNNSSMDGFAVRAQDTISATLDQPVHLRVVADIPAGIKSDVFIQHGESARIMTGAVLPESANAVVPVENTDFNVRRPGTQAPRNVKIFQSVKSGDYIRPKGQDVAAGEVVLHPGLRLRAQEVGFLAMLGVSSLTVYKRPRIALLSTGDELLNVGDPIEPGKIFDANSFTLASLIELCGGMPVHLGISADQEEEVRSRLNRAVELGVDLILSSAGVSVGAFDFVREIIVEGGDLTFWRVNMRPGKPLAFGSYKHIPFIGLPGNPVSAFVGFEVFIRPAIMKMTGIKNWRQNEIQVVITEPIESDGRESYLRAIVYEKEGRLIARLAGHQGSGNLRSLVQANALLIIPSEVKFVPAETKLSAWMIGEISR